MTSPVYSALPQELLLEADPRRPGIKTSRRFLLVKNLLSKIKTGFHRERKYRCQMQSEKKKIKGVILYFFHSLK